MTQDEIIRKAANEAVKSARDAFPDGDFPSAASAYEFIKMLWYDQELLWFNSLPDEMPPSFREWYEQKWYEQNVNAGRNI